MRLAATLRAVALAAALASCGDDRPEHCPDPRDPKVHYVENSDRDPRVCETIRFICVPGSTPFSDAQCGCGCVEN